MARHPLDPDEPGAWSSLSTPQPVTSGLALQATSSDAVSRSISTATPCPQRRADRGLRRPSRGAE